MTTSYRVLASAIQVLVAVQAAAIAWAAFGEGAYIARGGVIDKAFVENRQGPLPFPEIAGYIVHGLNGGLVIPLLATGLLVVSFFTRVRGAIRWGLIVFAVVVLQMSLGYAAHELPALGLLHGINAFVIIGVATAAASKVKAASPAKPLASDAKV